MNEDAMDDMDDPLRDWPARQRELLDILRSGGKILAVKNYRTWTGAGLKEAKEAVEALELNGSIPCPERIKPIYRDVSPAFEREIVTLLQAGQKIEAIKRYREAKQVDLREAKQSVEAIGFRNGIEPSKGCAGAILLGMLLAASGWAWLT